MSGNRYARQTPLGARPNRGERGGPLTPGYGRLRSTARYFPDKWSSLTQNPAYKMLLYYSLMKNKPGGLLFYLFFSPPGLFVFMCRC